MLTTADLDAMETKMHEMVVGAADTGNLTVLETADYAVRQFGRLLHEHRALLRRVSTKVQSQLANDHYLPSV